MLLFLCLRCVCSQRRCSVLAWNPDVATQLVVASEDDRTPTLQMWDLRNSMSPVKEFVGHVKVRTVVVVQLVVRAAQGTTVSGDGAHCRFLTFDGG